MDNTNQGESKLILVAALLKSLLLLLLASAAFVAGSFFLYGLWQVTTGLGWPLFVVAEAVVIMVAYWLGLLPAATKLLNRSAK